MFSTLRRLRKTKEGDNKYELDLGSLQISDNILEAEIVNKEAEDHRLKFLLIPISGNIFRIQIDEVKPLYQRYKPQYALNGEPQVAK